MTNDELKIVVSQLVLVPDYEDKRDYLYTDFDWRDELPAEVDLRQFFGQIENQLSVGSCTSHAVCKAAEMFAVANGQEDTEATDSLDLSRLFNYYTSRSYLTADYQQNDKGSTLRCALRAAKNEGVALESLWPYDVGYWNTAPNIAAYTDAENRKAGSYFRIQGKTPDCMKFYTPGEMFFRVKHALASGFPVIVGMNVGKHLLTLQPGAIYYPCNSSIDAQKSIGGHAMLIVGYTVVNKQPCFIVANSWGKQWGDSGYFLMSEESLWFDYFDLWVMKGFAGAEKVGPDLVRRYVEPVPEPLPVPPTPIEPPDVNPQPPIEPPKPVPPEPQPAPPIKPEKPKTNVKNTFPFWLLVAIMVGIAAYHAHKYGVFT